MNIELINLSLCYDKHPAVHQLSLSIEEGDLVGIVGPNGAGKSTLLNAMAGLLPVYKGYIHGLQANNVAYLPQLSHIDISFPITVEEFVSTGLWSKTGFFGALNKQGYDGCLAAIHAVGLHGLEKRMLHTLSGGQLQRTLFARVVLQQQPVILLDEPFNAIDAKTIADLTQVIKSWHQQKRTVVMVSHDLDYVKRHCPKALLLARECIAYGDASDVLTEDNLQRAKRQCEMFDEPAIWQKRSA